MTGLKLLRKKKMDVFGKEMELFDVVIDYAYLDKLLDKRQGIRIILPIMIPSGNEAKEETDKQV